MIIKELADKIRKYGESYYNGVSEISDAAFDQIWDRLKKLDPANCVFEEVGCEPSSGFPKARHKYLMGSLNKVQNFQELEEWLKKFNDNEEIIVEPKLDGLSLELVYEDGTLKQAITRGNGLEGNLVTFNASQILNIPLITQTTEKIYVRGEVLLPREAFHQLQNQDNFANPRNAASGILNRKNAKDCSHLSFIAFELVYENESFPATQGESYERLEYNGFTTPFKVIYPAYRTNLFKKEIESYKNSLRERLPYDIDGLVIKVNDITRQRTMGYLNNRPKWAVAYKFPAKTKTTVLKYVEWNTGKTGRVNPVAILEPVWIDGVKVHRAILNNADFISKLGIRKNSKVVVSRRNDVIPAIEEVLDRGEEPIKIPTKCPACKKPLVKKGKFLICDNKTKCTAIRKQRLNHWLVTLEIDGIGQKMLDQLVDAGYVNEAADFYRLEIDELTALEGWGQKTANNLILQFKNKKNLDFTIFLKSLSIPHLGYKRARALQQNSITIEDLLDDISNLHLENIEGIGYTVSERIKIGIKLREEQIRNLLQYVVIQYNDSSNVEKKLKGKSFLFTGKLQNIKRKEAFDLVEDLGGEIGLKGKMKYCITNDFHSQSSKAKQARNKGAEFITEEQFMEMINL